MKKLNSKREAMVHWSAQRYVKVAAPTVHAGIGDALRNAYQMNCETRSLVKFEDLLKRIG